LQYSTFAISRLIKKSNEKRHALKCAAPCLWQKRTVKPFRFSALLPVRIASGIFLLLGSTGVLFAQSTSESHTHSELNASPGAFSFSIPAQNANEALTELAKQANTTLLFPFDLAKKSED